MSSCGDCSKCCKGQCMINRENIKDRYTIALAGNPNVGKSTVFNGLTGLRQHTGNWPGKTVANARGTYEYLDISFELVDLPGTYSLFANSVEEEIARDYICFDKPDVTIVVVDATALERNLNLVLQILELTGKVVVCLNLIDEAKKKGIRIDVTELERELGVPVVPTVARDGHGFDQLMNNVLLVAAGYIKTEPRHIEYSPEVEELVSYIKPKIEEISQDVNSRWIALRFVDGDDKIIDGVKEHLLTQREEGDEQ